MHANVLFDAGWSAGCMCVGAAIALTFAGRAVLLLREALENRSRQNVFLRVENRRLREELACHVGAMRAVADAECVAYTEYPPTLIHEVLIAREEQEQEAQRHAG